MDYYSDKVEVINANSNAGLSTFDAKCSECTLLDGGVGQISGQLMYLLKEESYGIA